MSGDILILQSLTLGRADAGRYHDAALQPSRGGRISGEGESEIDVASRRVLHMRHRAGRTTDSQVRYKYNSWLIKYKHYQKQTAVRNEALLRFPAASDQLIHNVLFCSAVKLT